MSSALNWSAGAASGPFDVVGDRVLVGVQAVNISRLSTHPIPMISQGLVTVAGQGPKDSNGAGKSSLIAAVSLLHADEQWRLASGAAGAAELLFSAEMAAQDGRWSNVDWGYVIGVFADPRATSAEELSASALSVWLRINRKASHLDLRWCEGLHVPFGATETERAAGVDKLWNALPRSNGRSDFHANRLAGVLYGGHVRCVSFLSTSVRASPAANLLAQPLNDLDPHRIFDAIATLTGLDRELEQERAMRSAEHAHRTEVLDAEKDLAGWEVEVAIVEAGIAKRVDARNLLGMADASWRARCARRLLDGVTRLEEIRHSVRELDRHAEELRPRLEAVDDELTPLLDDVEFGRQCDEDERRYRELEAQDKALDTQHQVTVQKVEELTARHRQLSERARAADGRDVAQAGAEESSALEGLEQALAARGAAAAAEAQAQELLTAAESGDDVAAEVLRALRAESVPAAALVDVVQLSASQRASWEPRLVPYRGAVVVPRVDASRAADALAGRAGIVLVVADEPGGGDAGLPGSADARFGLATFLTALAGRAGSAAAEVDVAAGVIVPGELADPLTGRASRIGTARAEHQARAAALVEATEAVAVARSRRERAAERTRAASAAEEAAEVQERIVELRQENEKRESQSADLAPLLATAHTSYAKALGARNARAERIANLRTTKRGVETELRNTADAKVKLATEREDLNLPGREADWGDTHQSAERHLLSLEADLQERTTASWNEEACHQLNEVVRRCFPDGTSPDEMPAEVRELLIEQRWQRGGLEVRVNLVAPLIRSLREHLKQTEQQDLFDQRQIAVQRTQRSGDLEKARQGLSEAEQASRAHRSTLAQGIKAKLKRVSDEFNRLDEKYGGYGAGMDYPEPEPPSEPDRPWRWAVTPKWRRAEGQRLASYNLRGNTAQMDEKAVKLVCAAALAGGGSRPLLLILDELGRNLGKQHRREAVALFEQIGVDRAITVIGALQDDMERYAIEASGLYIKLRRRSDSMAYNEAPVVVGDESNHARVELLRSWLSSYRPSPDLGAEEGDGEAVA